jgi:catechol 2,3-dioxygenase-like lactoylglutathione lyase family enzyme
MDEAMNGPSAVCRNAARFIAEGEGLGGVALETTDLDAAIAALRRAGAEPGPVVDMQRVQKDGFVSVSRILYPTHASGVAPLPIVIERNLGPETRRPLLVERRVIAPHAVGEVSIDSVAVAVADVEAAAALYVSAFGFEPAGRYDDPVLGGACVRLGAGRGDIVLCEPRGAGPAAARLARGAGPFAIAFKAADAKAVAARLGADADGVVGPAGVHGAMLRIVAGS